MKKLTAMALIALPLAFSARAQWIVHDPGNTVQSVINTAQEIAKYVTMIDNQVRQIQTLTDQLHEFQHYEDLFGDPKKVALSMVSALNADLIRTERGMSLENLLTIASGDFALTYNEAGIFQTVGRTFTTPHGQTLTRPADRYKPFAAVSRTADNFVTVAADTAARRGTIKAQIAQTTEQLRNATTDAEVQKLQGVLSSLHSDLASTEAELNQALGSALIQDVQNRNDQQKQIQALTEQQNAEFEEATRNYRAAFPLLAAPTPFPTQ